MAKYSLTNKGNVVQCKWNCACNHEHYIGTYERAVKYFGIEQDEIKSYGNLLNIIIYHQTSQYTVPKLSNELYDIMISAMSEHKYWTKPSERHKRAMETLKIANKKNYIMDKIICKTIEEKGNINAKKRKYMYEVWCKQNDI